MPQSQPMYRHIADDLRDQITRGKLAPNVKLPTEGELSDQYEASRNTIRDAIKRLASQGLVETRPGQGTFVAPGGSIPSSPCCPPIRRLAPTGAEGATYLSDVSTKDRRARVTVPTVEIQTPNIEVGRRLRVPPRSQVVSRHQRRYIDEIPWSLQTSFYPMEFITKGATRLLMDEDIEEGSVRYLGE